MNYKHWADLIARQETFNKMANQMSSIEKMTKMIAIATKPQPTTTLEYFTKGLLTRNINPLPTSAYNSILAIGQQYNRMSDISKTLGNSLAMATAVQGFTRNRNLIDHLFQNQRLVAQMASLQTAVGGISGQLASIYTRNRDWNSLDTFADLTTRVADIEERLSGSQFITKDDLLELREFFTGIFDEIKAGAKRSDRIAIISLWIGIISLFLTFLPLMLPDTNKHDVATKEEVQSMHKELTAMHEELKELHNVISEQPKHSVIQRTCKMYLKPKTKSIVVNTIKKDVTVVVLQTSHKWCYISYINQLDGLTENGWVMKKYIEVAK